MKLVNKKTQKAIRKSVKKVIKKHGPEMAASLAGGIASTLATLASTDAPGTKGQKSNLAKLSRKVSDTVLGEDGKKARKRAEKAADEQRVARGKKAGPRQKPSETTA